MKEILKSILNTLDTIEVRGKTNIDRMLGCMMTLEKIIEAFEKDVKNDANDHAE